MYLLHYLIVFQSWYNVYSNAAWKFVALQGKFVALQKLLPCLMFQLVNGHRLNACDISISACDKVRLIQVRCQDHVLCHIFNIARPDTFPLRKYIINRDRSEAACKTSGRYESKLFKIWPQRRVCSWTSCNHPLAFIFTTYRILQVSLV